MEPKQQFWDIVNKALRSDPRKAEKRRSASDKEPSMEVDIDKVADAIFALSHLGSCDERVGDDAWKSVEGDALHRLCEKGYVVTNSSGGVASNKEGATKAEELFWKLFGKST